MSNRNDLTRFIALADKMAAAHDNMGLEGMGIHHVEAHSALLEAIAELKRCYERIDYLEAKVSDLECDIAETEYQQGHHRYVD